MTSIFKEPLLHFFVLAAGIFWLHGTLAPRDQDTAARTIVVDQQQLLSFIQYRKKTFDAEAALRTLDQLSPAALDSVVQEYVREEAMAREARALSLDRDDYIIKRRLVQSLEHIAQGFANSGPDIAEDRLRAYFEENKSDFFIEPRITFTHVFFGTQNRGADDAMRLAENTLAGFDDQEIAFKDALRFGERFLYGANFVDRTLRDVEGQFGPALTQQLFDTAPAQDRWLGPLLSEHGAHLVLVTGVVPGRQPRFEEVAERVAREVAGSIKSERTREATQQIVDSYQVDLRYGASEVMN